MASKQDLDKIADEAAERAVNKAMPKFQEVVNETFEHFGFDPSSPIQIQELMVNVKRLVENDSIKALAESGFTKADFISLRDMLDDYRNSEDIKHHTKKGVTGWFAKGAIGIALAGAGAWVGSFFQGGGGFPPVQ